jgi:hypothetical protein
VRCLVDPRIGFFDSLGTPLLCFRRVDMDARKAARGNTTSVEQRCSARTYTSVPFADKGRERARTRFIACMCIVHGT